MASPADAHARGLGAAVRHQPPRPLRPGHRPARRRSPRPAAPGSSRSAPARTCARPSSSTTSTSSERAYEPWAAYGQSKTANVLFAVEATRRWAGDGITVNALMPGGDPDQPAALRHRGGARPAARRRPAAATSQWKTPEQGAATSVLVATSPLLDGVGGRYFEDCNEAEPRRQPRARRRGLRARPRGRGAALAGLGGAARALTLQDRAATATAAFQGRRADVRCARRPQCRGCSGSGEC